MPNIAFSDSGAYPNVGTTMYSSSIGNSYLNSGYYKISGSASNFYWIQINNSLGVVSQTGTCGPTP